MKKSTVAILMALVWLIYALILVLIKSDATIAIIVTNIWTVTSIILTEVE